MALEFTGDQEEIIALEARKSAVVGVLSNPQLRAAAEDEILEKAWLDELRTGLGPTIERAIKRGLKTAFVIQFADASLRSPSDAGFINTFLEHFGARAIFTDGTRMETTAANLSTIARYQILRRVQMETIGGGKTDLIPDGSLMIEDEEGNNSYLVLETNIEGVRLIMDGSAISNPLSSGGQVRPMLLVKIGEHIAAPLTEVKQEAKTNKRKTWRQVHGREPGARRERKDLYQRQLESAAIKGDDQELEVAGIAHGWQPLPKSAEEIMVTPTVLREKPAIASEKERQRIIEQALATAVGHINSAEQSRTRPVVGRTVASLSIITEVLGMTAEEIEQDGEAMADLVEYLEEMARTTRGVVGHSSLLDEAPTGDPTTEMVNKIKATWVFPTSTMGQGPFMFERVNYTKRQGPNASNN